MQKTYRPSLRLMMITLGILAVFVLSVRMGSTPGQAAASQAASAEIANAPVQSPVQANAQAANQPNEPVGEAVIGDFVWLDTNLNGLEAPTGEPGIAGVFLRLWEDDNDFVFDPAKDTYLSTTVTADGSGTKPAGFYQFNVSRGQTYWVEVMDSNFDPGGPLHNYMLTSGLIKGDEPMIVPFVDADGTDVIDFGYAPTGIALVKRAGSAPNGGIHYIPQAGANVTFTYAYTNTGLTELINVEITDDNGTPANTADDFQVCTVAKLIAGATGTCTAANRPISTNHTNIATIVGTPTVNFELGAEVRATDDAVVALFASVGDRVWNDANSNGIQDTGELGVAGVTVQLFNGDGVSQGITTTNGSGLYRFDNLIAGQYKVKVTLPNGFQFSPQDQGADDTKDSDVNTGTGETAIFTLQAGDVQLKWDAGIFNNAGIGDKVWEDLNANGIQDAGEPGIDKVTVRLFSGAGVELNSTTTDGSGLYRFSNLVGGNYYLVFDAPGGYSFTLPNVGDDTKDSDFDPALGRTATFTLPVGQSDITQDAGLYRSASLGDRVWQDLNANGIQDSGEPNIPGVTVELYNSANTKIDTKVTNGSGIYSFSGLTPGQYDVKFVQPTGYRPTLQNQGSNDAVDSDASPTTGRTGSITLISGENDLTWDGGFYVPGAINVVKTANPTTIVSGQLVTYTYVITNGGGLPVQNVTVTDDKCSPVSARISGDINSDNRLDISESWLYRCSTTLTQTTTNTVTAVGTDLAANPVSDTDKAVVTVVTPRINVVKTANPTVILANQVVAYTFVVTNPGNVPLSSVTVSDNKCASVVYQSGDANTNNVLETTESWTYTCSQPLSVTTTNIVTASGQPASPAGVPLPGIGRVQATATATVTVIAPAIDIVKTVTPATVYVNGTVTYTFRVSNTGNVTLGTVTVADNKCSPLTRTGGDANSNNRLEVGEIWTYTCSRSLAQDTVNTATVTGQPVDGSGVPIPGVNSVSDQDTATANVINPAIRIVKSASASIVNQGDSVTYTLNVSNIGDDPLTSVTTTDNKCSPLSGPTPVAPANGNNILEPGETWRYTCTAVLTQDTTNIASTQGTDSLGNPVTDTDEIFVDVITAGIRIQKTASASLVYSGTQVTYTFQVSNTGTSPLSNVVVTDDKCSPISARLSGDTNADNKLDPGEIWAYSCARPLAQTTVNVVTVTGQDPLGATQTDQSSATVRVISPAINVVKSVDKTVIVSGTQVIYSYLVTNPGNDPLSTVTVSDNKCAPLTAASPNPGDVANVGKLDPGERWTYSCTTALTQTTLNTVTAAGVDSLGGPVQDTDTANVTVVKPGISLVKSVNKSVVRPGTAVVYTYVVKNTGDTPLATLNLTDDKCTPLARQSGDANSNNVLETTETWTYTCQSTISQTTVNIAVVTGQPSDPAGVPLLGINPVTAQDTATVRVINPGIEVVKSANPTTIYSGNVVTYSYTVRNTGNSTLNTVAISDDKCSPVTYVSGDANNNQQMEVTEVWAYRCTTSLTVDTLNTVTVNAKDESGGTVTDTATATVNVINPGITVDKQTTTTAVSSGTVVTYTYAVTNSGDDPLSSVKVTDNKCSPVTFVNGDTNNDSKLDLTEVWNYICAMPLTATTTNVATATGNDSLGNPVNDTDTVTVQVFGLATIGDRIWLDSNANGIQDASETSGVAGALVTLYQNNTVVMTQTTPANGSYLFSNLIPGDYSVGVTLPAGYRFSPQNQGSDPAKDSDVNVNTGRMVVTTLASGETDRTWDAGLYRPASLGDRVWEDRNANGIQDTDETGLGGVTVLLYNGTGGLVTSATTQPDGSYFFDNLTPGDYQIQVTPPQSYLFTLPTVGSDRAVDSNVSPADGKSGVVTLASGEENRTIDAGLYRLASLGDRAWLDTNQDGIQNNNEAGINGVTITLFKGDGTQVMTRTTSAGGVYLFTGLVPGSYYVQAQLLPDYVFTIQYAGTNRAADSNVDRTTGRTETIALSSGDVNLTLDAGLVVAAPRIQSIKTSELAVDDDNNGVISPGDTLTYRIVISNIGTAPATNVGFSDGLDPNTSLVVGSVTTDRGTVVLGNSAGNTSVQVAVGTLLPTESATIVLRTQIHNPLPDGVTSIVNQGVVSSVELPDEPTDDDGLGGGTGDPTVAPIQPRGFRLYMPFLSAQPPAVPTPTPSPTPSPTPTPDGGGGPTGIPCDAPGCALPDLIHPKSMAVSVSKNLLYVVSRDNDRLLKVDPQTMQVMNTALTGDEPWGVVVNEATNLVYVGNFASADVWVYNADTLALVTKIRLGNPGETKPALMELLPSLNTVAVVLHGNNGVALIQGLTLTQVIGATGQGTYGIAVDVVNNRIFVSNRDAGNTRVIYRTEFGQWKNDGYEFTNSDRRVPFELAYNPNSKRLYSVYVINNDWLVDTYYERSNGSWGLLATTPVGQGGGARDPNVGGTGLVVNLVTGHVFNTNSADNTVTVMDANGTVLATVGTGVDPFTAVVNPATQVVFVGMRDARNTVSPDTVQKIIDNY